VDYAAVAEALRQKLTPQSFRLIETVAEQAADLVLWKYKPRSVTVLLKKRALPGLAWAGVEIHRP
jgi:dihydroneopterin aldolase